MANKSKASNLIAFVAALFIYSAFALYLYLPHLNVFAPYRRLLIPAAILAAAGTYLLSRRWISSAIASFFAGLVYAFGPFALGFGLYHPAASALIAALPFSLMPAAFWPHRPFRWAPLITAALALLPFVMIFSFFLTAAHYGLYPIPRNQRLQLAPFTGLITPLILEPLHFPYPGFYHVAVAPLIFGLFLFFRIHRAGATAFCLIGIALSFYAALGQTSPIVWALLPILCFSILTGLGFQGLIVASNADKNALANCSVLMAVIAAVSAAAAYNSPESTLFFRAASWYIVAAFGVYLVMILAINERRMHLLRWLALLFPAAVDIFISARIIVDKIF